MRLTLVNKMRPSPALVVAILALVVALAGVAYATIPDSGGVIHGCYLKAVGSLRVIDPTSQHCTRHETAIHWNQTGPQGLAGPAGPQGLKGDVGAAGATGPQGPAGQSGEWEVVDAGGSRISGTDFGIMVLYPGGYQITKPNVSRNCAIQVTPDYIDTGQPYPPSVPALASVGPGLGEAGFVASPVTIHITNLQGIGMDDSFVVSVQC